MLNLRSFQKEYFNSHLDLYAVANDVDKDLDFFLSLAHAKANRRTSFQQFAQVHRI